MRLIDIYILSWKYDSTASFWSIDM